MGLPEGHPEKNGVTIDLADLVREVKERLRRKEKEYDDGEGVAEVGEVTRRADGLSVGEPEALKTGGDGVKA